MRKILVVEDEDSIREVIALNLHMAGYEVTEAASAEDALKVFDTSFDAAVLDIMLPGMNGFSLCETIRRDSQSIGIIILSAKGLETDKIRGLSIGADDYMTKPFSVSELLARVDALVRRVSRSSSSEKTAEHTDDSRMVSGSFVLDKKSRALYKDGTPIELTQVEFQIMELFFANPGVALVREEILKGVWGENYFGDVKIVDVNIRRLRMKIEDDAGTPTHILTVWGYGYRWNA
ncbi:MAG: response regulator transcription factor [Clostridia bacterium]|nr:response regulator transcription factor [Clostridia bacterium]